MTFAEVQPPYRIVEHGRYGKYNRIRVLGTYTLTPGPSNTTVVEYTFESVPVMPSDRLMEMLGGRSWMRKQVTKALRRLRRILEENRGRGKRATVAARN
jgi:hypothetical protein